MQIDPPAVTCPAPMITVDCHAPMHMNHGFCTIADKHHLHASQLGINARFLFLVCIQRIVCMETMAEDT